MKRIARFLLAFAMIGVPVARGADAPPDGLPAVPLSDNAALQYWQASSAVSEATKKRLQDFDDIVIEGDALVDARDGNPAIEMVHAGAAMSKCDWGLDVRKGPELLLPHLGMSRTLGRLTLLRARYRFEQGRWRDGLSDVLSTFELAKDAGDTPITISLLVRYNIEQTAVDVLARQLPKMGRPTLDELAKALETIPSPDPFKLAFPMESKYFVDWTLDRLDKIDKESGGDSNKWSEGVLALSSLDDALELRRLGVPPPAEMKAMIGSIKTLLAEEEQIAGLPATEQDARLAELPMPYASSPIMQKFRPAQVKIFQTRHRWQTRHAMLKAAVAVIRDGEAALKDKKYADPFGDGPFAYHKTGDGFELQSKLLFEDKPVSLVVGIPKK